MDLFFMVNEFNLCLSTSKQQAHLDRFIAKRKTKDIDTDLLCCQTYFWYTSYFLSWLFLFKHSVCKLEKMETENDYENSCVLKNKSEAWRVHAHIFCLHFGNNVICILDNRISFTSIKINQRLFSTLDKASKQLHRAFL